MIVAVPAATAVRKPVPATMVATPVLLLLQLPPPGNEDKVVLKPEHMAPEPVIAVGTRFTVTVCTADTVPQELVTV